jgi:hypothetical protein
MEYWLRGPVAEVAPLASLAAVEVALTTRVVAYLHGRESYSRKAWP